MTTPPTSEQEMREAYELAMNRAGYNLARDANSRTEYAFSAAQCGWYGFQKGAQWQASRAEQPDRPCQCFGGAARCTSPAGCSKLAAPPSDLHAAIMALPLPAPTRLAYGLHYTAEDIEGVRAAAAELAANTAPAQTTVAVPEAVKLAGVKMANTMFNLAQDAVNFTDLMRANFKAMQVEWDAAIRAAHQQDQTK